MASQPSGSNTCIAQSTSVPNHQSHPVMYSAWPQKCAVCAVEIHSLMNMTIHMASHHNSDNVPKHTSVPGQGDQLPSDPQSPLQRSEEEEVTCSSSKPQNTSDFICSCFLCGMKFTTYIEREEHRCTDRLECNVCGDKFVLPDIYETHTLTHKQNREQETKGQEYLHRKKLDCLHCKKVIPYIDLQFHRCIAQHLCNYCGMELSNSENLKIHQRRHIIKPPPFERGVSLQNTKKVTKIPSQKTCKRTTDMDKPIHKCCQCGQEFYKTEHFRAHAILLHNCSDTFTITGKICLVCGTKFQNKKALRAHQFSLHKCNLCEETFRTEDLAKKHRITHFRKQFTFNCTGTPDSCTLTEHTCKPYKCVVCNESFDTHANLESHKCAPLTCTKCDKSFATKVALTSHTCERWRCSFCHKYFLSELLIIAHRCANRPCPDCGKASKTKEEAENHVCQLYACALCQKPFDIPLNLKEHVCMHEKCSTCDKTLPKQGASVLQKDLCVCPGKSKDPEKSKEYTDPPFRMLGGKHICSICGKTFKNVTTLIKHNSSSYSCTVCDEVFCKIPILQKHVRDHTVKEVQNSKISKRVFEARDPAEKAAQKPSARHKPSHVLFSEQNRGPNPQASTMCTKPLIIKVPIRKADPRKNVQPDPSTPQSTTSTMPNTKTSCLPDKCSVCGQSLPKPGGTFLQKSVCVCNKDTQGTGKSKEVAVPLPPTLRKKHICNICGKIYSDMSSFKRHKMSSHLCIVCDEEICSIQTLEAHAKKHTIKDIQNPKSSRGLVQAKSSVQKTAKQPSVQMLSSAPSSKRKHDSSPVSEQCNIPQTIKAAIRVPDTGEKAQSESSSPQLTSSVRPNTSKFSNTVYKCNNCGIFFCNKDDLKRHNCVNIKDKHEYDCPLCNQHFMSPLLLQRHTIERHSISNPFSCDKCRSLFTSKKELANHKLECGKTIYLSDKSCQPEKCPRCQKVYLTKEYLQKHKCGILVSLLTGKPGQNMTSLIKKNVQTAQRTLSSSNPQILISRPEDFQGQLHSHSAAKSNTRVSSGHVVKDPLDQISTSPKRTHIVTHIARPIAESRERHVESRTFNLPATSSESIMHHIADKDPLQQISTSPKRTHIVTHIARPIAESRERHVESRTSNLPATSSESITIHMADNVYSVPHISSLTRQSGYTCPVCKHTFPTATTVKTLLQHSCPSWIVPNVESVPPLVIRPEEDVWENQAAFLFPPTFEESTVVDIGDEAADGTPPCEELLPEEQSNNQEDHAERVTFDKTSCKHCVFGFESGDELEKHLGSHYDV